MRNDQIEDVYPLSPMQTGMLFHSLYSAEAHVYLNQQIYTLEGNLNVTAFKRAWQYLIERYSVLRTSFHWEGLEEPLQVVHKQVELPLEQQDWSALSESEQQVQLRELLTADRKHGIEIARAPLMHLTLAYLGRDTWQFVWTTHHLLLDRWSGTQLLRELKDVYEALCKGRHITLPPVRPYGDYIGWLQAQDSSQAETYWRRALIDFETPTILPIDKAPGSLAGKGETRRHQIWLSDETSSALQSLARQNHLTLNTLVQGAWALLLSRYSGEEDILFGATVSGRPASLPGVESMVGLFINSLPVRVHVEGSASLLEWLQQLQENMQELREYEHSSLVEIQGWSDVPRGVPLFESLVVVQNIQSRFASTTQEEEQKLALTIRSVGSESTGDFPLMLLVVPGSQLGLVLSYDNSRYEEADIVSLLGHLSNLLEGMIADPRCTLSRLPLLSKAERRQLLVEWNDTQEDFPPLCAHHLFENFAQKTPEAIAVLCEGKSLTYRELNRRANQLAHWLKKQGVGPDVRVGLYLERSVEIIVGLLGVLKAGGAYLPLDPALPQERIGFMLQDSQAPLVLTQQELREALSSFQGKHLCLDTEWDTLAVEPQTDPAGDVDMEHLAYVIYTSGSTGTPKGVLVEHRGLSNYVHSILARLQLPAGSRYASVSTLAADLGNTVVFGALCNGGTLHLIALERAMDPDALSAYFQAEGIDCLKIVPSHLSALLKGAVAAEVLPRQVLVLGGEASPWSLVERIRELAPTCRILNHYGPTETTVGVLTYPVSSAAAETSAGLPLGRPLPNTRMYVLDRYGDPVPVGVAGELYIGGAQVARGYLNRPELTSERFVGNPFVSDDRERLYRTGDLVRYLPSGNLEFLGRTDHQVKIRGYRIELGEIENALREYPGVREALVVAREDTPETKRLVGYFVADKSVVQSELREHLKEKLPDYMVPSAFVKMEALPLTSNGKVDRKALPSPDFPEGAEEFATPRTPIEEGIAEIYREVLRLKQVSAHDSFFELGGHSLLATQMISRIRSTFQVELPLRAIFEAPTVAELAQRIGIARGDEHALAPPLVPVARTEDLPLSFAQQRLWFLDQLEPGSAVYNVPGALRLLGTLNTEALQQSLDEIVRRHEALRTTFRMEEDMPCQVIHSPAPVALPLMDLTSFSETQRAQEAQRLTLEEAQRSFPLERGPVFRAVLLRLGEEEHVLLWTVHHIVSDGWSMGVLRRELETLYNAFAAGKPSPLPDLPIQYADYAAWQRNWLQGEVLERQIAYWKEHLAGAPALLELPTDRPRPHVQTFRGAIQRRQLSPELTQQLKALGQQEGATLFMTLMAAFQTLLFRYSGQDQVVVGTPIANRTQSELEGLIGSLMNTLALRGDLSGNPSFRELLGRVREMCLGAYAHQDLPFEKLVEELQPERSMSHSAVFQVMLVLQNAPRGVIKLEGLRIEGISGSGITSKFDLLLAAGESDSGLRLGLEYNTDLFDEQTIERMLGHFEQLLSGIVANPDQSLARLPLLPPSEQRQLLVEWNRTSYSFPDLRLHQLAEQQADRAPEAVALLFEEQVLTYAELDTRANQLAHYLRTLGIGPGIFVGVALERSLDLMVALLGVHKAGGAYLPLDPSYPPERLAYMLEDAQTPVLLTQARIADRLPQTSALRICLDADASQVAVYPAHRPEVVVDREEAAYIIYTSGSTGKPKGVVVPHRAIQNHMHWMQQSFPLQREDRVLQKTPLSFDASVWECWSALMVGAPLVIARPDGHADPTYLVRLIQEQGITTLKLVPSLLQMLLGEPAFGACHTLRQVFCGAEALSRDLCERFYACFGEQVALHNLYGPTEAAIDATGYSCSPGWERAGVPIGRPIANVCAYLLDGQMQPVPIGVLGELYLGGTSLARGYLNAGNLTAEKFVPDPFRRQTGERLYRTGDLCRWLPDGNIEFIGRLDHQVKVRGFRIELGEIESALREHPGVEEALVLAREDEPGVKRLVAYLVANTDTPMESSGLRSFLKERLPEYMLPSAFVILEAFPLTPSGKIDRGALPIPEFQAPQESYVAPHTPIEEGLVEIWSDLLRLEKIGIQDNFFESGGHSLLATQVISRIRSTFQIELPLRALFEAPTIAQLAQQIEEFAREGVGLKRPPLLPAPYRSEQPLSFSQQRLWFLYELQPESPLYNLPRSLRLRGKLDISALQCAFEEILRRHQILRTTYHTLATEPVQVVSEEIAFPLPLHDLSALDPSQRQDRLRQLCQQEAARPFDLSQDHMLRAQLLRLEEEEHVLLMTLHHIASDGWSQGILTRELSALYNAFSTGASSPLPALPIQYVDYAVWQQDWLSGEALERQIGYWSEQLEGAPPLLALPIDRPRSEASNYRGGRERFVLSQEMSAHLREMCRSQRATPFMVLLAAFKLLLYRWTGQSDLVVGTDVANRTLQETEGLIGFFLNHLVLRTDLSGDLRFSEVVGRVREVCLGAYAHQDLPFEKLVEELQPERSSSHTPLFQVLFVLQNVPAGQVLLNGLETEGLGNEFGSSKYDLSLFLGERNGTLVGAWVYRTDLFKETTIRKLSHQFQTLLGQVLSHPEKCIEDVELASTGSGTSVGEAARGSGKEARGTRRRSPVIQGD